MLNYKAKWKKSVASDLQSQEFHLILDGAETITALDAVTEEFDYSAPQGANVEWFIRSIDDAGNLTDSEHQQFVAQDNIPPEAATDLQTVPTGESN